MRMDERGVQAAEKSPDIRLTSPTIGFLIVLRRIAIMTQKVLKIQAAAVTKGGGTLSTFISQSQFCPQILIDPVFTLAPIETVHNDLMVRIEVLLTAVREAQRHPLQGLV